MVKILNTIMKDAVWAVIAIMGGVCSFAGDVQAPSSLAVAEAQCSIVYQNGQEKDSLHFSDGLSYEGAESKITRYEPKGTSALITAVYVDKTKEAPIGGEYYEKDPSQYRRYILSGEASYEKACGKNPSPATIIFTDKGGRRYYKGVLKGYLTCNKDQTSKKLVEITIMLDEKFVDPELAEIREKFKGEITGRQATILRYDLIEYWDGRLKRVYQALMAHYAKNPSVAGKLRTAQRNWIACRDATEEAYGLCLKGGEENEPEDEWFRANITRLQLDFIETRCAILEELLDTVKFIVL